AGRQRGGQQERDNRDVAQTRYRVVLPVEPITSAGGASNRDVTGPAATDAAALEQHFGPRL
ncbi:MAG: hypothetical protein ACYTF5_22240, partial [Planctomycetota bacterium]